MCGLIALVCLLALPLPAAPMPGIALPPVSDRDQRLFTIAALLDLEVSHIRIAENWSRRRLTGRAPYSAAICLVDARPAIPGGDPAPLIHALCTVQRDRSDRARQAAQTALAGPITP